MRIYSCRSSRYDNKFFKFKLESLFHVEILRAVKPKGEGEGEEKRKIHRNEIYAAGFMTQLRYCLWRGAIVQKRDLSKLGIQLGTKFQFENDQLENPS